MFLFSVKTTDDIDTYINEGGDINFQNIAGQTFLHKLVQENNLELLDHFLTKKPKVNIKDFSGSFPICYSKSTEAAQKLLLAGSQHGLHGKEINQYVVPLVGHKFKSPNIKLPSI